MAIKYGRAKHVESVTADDCVKHPIWVMAHRSKFHEEGVQPIVNKVNVDREVLRARVPIIAVQIEGTDIYGLACYDHDSHDFSSLALLIGGKWVDAFDKRTRLEFPVTFAVLPQIMGQAGVRFVWKSRKAALQREAARRSVKRG
ncbi:MAG TPA: hypothetical protein VFB80_16845 [Pirellulaceae bacterium]|nr:hypothetical protein [Pirellulaceae bacterium]